MRLEVTSLFLTDRPHSRLVTYAPADDAAWGAVRRLAHPDRRIWVAPACTGQDVEPTNDRYPVPA